ncbi:RNA polymerase sigma-70 factor [Sunxiuqinia sp. A32]|uniref:RNA polymerase sigma-70 factor n=1 Tax=Sunxiuqinia sp. A32 TaxID=3461496 RepID=UPI00404577E7
MEAKPYKDFEIESAFFLEKLKEGDRKTFTLIFDYYYTGLVVFADKYMHDIELSEDIVQSVFVKLWENREYIRSSSIKSYLSSAVKNNCIDLIRKKETQDKYVQRQKSIGIDSEHEFWAEHELQKMVEDSIRKLPSRCREIFKMSRYDGLKSIEIADKLGISQRTVETQITKALKILRKDLKDYLFQLFLTF